MRRALLAAAALTFSFAITACSAGGPSSAPPSGPEATAPGAASPSAPGAPSAEVSPMSSIPEAASPAASTATLTLTSSAFAAEAAVPREYTCDGANVSPPLAWTGAPAGAAALVLFVDDPDARDFVHWTVLDLPAADGGLAKGVAPSAATPQQGTNDFGKPGWGGPCPPSGTHHYRFTLTAIAAPLGLGGHPGGAAVRSALAKAHVLGKATLTATYKRA
jgi:Raf kinase inhibitor-like YbhB/YbcL family protein